MTLDQLYALFVERDNARKQLAVAETQLLHAQLEITRIREARAEAIAEAEKARVAAVETSKQATLQTCAQRLDLVLTGKADCADFDKMLAAVAALKARSEAGIEIGDYAVVVSFNGQVTWRSDVGFKGRVIEIDANDNFKLVAEDATTTWVSRCDVRKVTDPK